MYVLFVYSQSFQLAQTTPQKEEAKPGRNLHQESREPGQKQEASPVPAHPPHPGICSLFCRLCRPLQDVQWLGYCGPRLWDDPQLPRGGAGTVHGQEESDLSEEHPNRTLPTCRRPRGGAQGARGVHCCAGAYTHRLPSG